MAFIESQSASPMRPHIWVSDEGGDKCLLRALEQMVAVGAKSIMILACEADQYSPERLNPILTSYPVPLFGGIFPAVFCATHRLEQGFILVGYPFSVSVSVYQQLSSGSFNILEPDLRDASSHFRPENLMVLVDAVANATEPFINTLYETIGGGINVIGGGAGAIDFIPRPCLFSRAGLLGDAALVIELPVVMQCAMDHGWERLSGPYLVTESEGAKVKTIDYSPAYDVYKSVLEEVTDYRLAESDFFQTAQNFPLGIVGMCEDILVRDPVKTHRKDLLCVGNVPINSMIYLLRGDVQRIIQAAESTGLHTRNVAPSQYGLAMVFDCVSRMLYLGDQFNRELEAITRGVGTRVDVVGTLSIGEIANTYRGTISLLNKSITIGKI